MNTSFDFSIFDSEHNTPDNKAHFQIFPNNRNLISSIKYCVFLKKLQENYFHLKKARTKSNEQAKRKDSLF